MNSFPWEGLLRLCEVVSVGAGVLTVAALIGQVVAGRVVGNRKTVELENLKLNVAKQQEVAGRLEIEAARQQERAAKAESDLLALQRRVKDRHLTAEQRKQLSKTLKAGRGGVVQIKTTVGDREAFDFATELGEVIAEAREAGWEPKCCDRDRLPLGLSGIEIWVSSSDGGLQYVRVLQTALRQINLLTKIVPKDDLPEGGMILVVGPKP